MIYIWALDFLKIISLLNDSLDRSIRNGRKPVMSAKNFYMSFDLCFNLWSFMNA